MTRYRRRARSGRCCGTMDTPVGPLTWIPVDLELWNSIYSPEKLAELSKLVDTAAKKCRSDQEAAERCRFMGSRLFTPLKESEQLFRRNQDSIHDWSSRLNENIFLRPYHIDCNEENTIVKVKEDQDNFIFRFECEEPKNSVKV